MYAYSIVCAVRSIGIWMCITLCLYSVHQASTHFRFCRFNVCQIVDGAKFTANSMSNCVTASGHAELCNQHTNSKMENRKQRQNFFMLRWWLSLSDRLVADEYRYTTYSVFHSKYMNLIIAVTFMAFVVHLPYPFLGIDCSVREYFNSIPFRNFSQLNSSH